MGKILKYCGSCDEGFADKFQFCPNCGATLQAFEMKPVAAEAKATREVSAQPPAPAFIEPAVEAARVIEETPAPVEEPIHEVPAVEAASSQESEIAEQEPVIETPAFEEPTIAIPAAAAA